MMSRGISSMSFNPPTRLYLAAGVNLEPCAAFFFFGSGPGGGSEALEVFIRLDRLGGILRFQCVM